jgi:acyl-CoA synthetase (NDP forming)
LRALFADPGVDAAVVVLTSIADPDAIRVAQEVVEGHCSAKPLVISWLFPVDLARAGHQVLTRNGLTVFDEPTHAVRALGALAHRGRADDVTSDTE